jgi:leader peptidase (prepilin peptidase)/N-methyltransferase
VSAALVILAGLFGLAVGSFLNVVIHRVPAGLSVVRPASRCPDCGAAIRPQHNIPVVGWLLLRGKCADCKSPISIRYPLVELGTGLLFAALTAKLASLQLLPALPAYLWFGGVGVALALIDLETRRLPNILVLPSYPVIAVALAASCLWTHDWNALLRAGVGGAALFAFFLLIALVVPRSMGMGDVKLSGLIGMVLGYLSYGVLIIGAFAGFLLGAIVGLIVIGSGKGTRKSALPFGPFMIAGALLAIFFGQWLVDLYTQLTGR